jgi:F-type H+-transporting ATPase subunit b
MKNARLRFALGTLGFIFASAFVALPARAAQAEQSKAAEEPDPIKTPAGVAFRWLNFLIVFGVAGYFIVKKGAPAFKAHAKDISAGIASAAAVKAEADAQLRAAETGFARLPQDTATMRETATREFVTESEHLRTGTETEVTRIETAATAEVNAARRAARIELREVAARLAAARAAEIVGQQITPAQRAALVQKFVDGLPATTSESRGVN